MGGGQSKQSKPTRSRTKPPKKHRAPSPALGHPRPPPQTIPRNAGRATSDPLPPTAQHHPPVRLQAGSNRGQAPTRTGLYYSPKGEHHPKDSSGRLNCNKHLEECLRACDECAGCRDLQKVNETFKKSRDKFGDTGPQWER